MPNFQTSVPLPTLPKERDPGYPRTENKRSSEEALLRQLEKKSKKRAQVYLDHVQVFQVPTTLENLATTKPDLNQLEAVCASLEKRQPIPISTRIIDENGRVLMDIMASRRIDSPTQPNIRPISEIYEDFHSQKLLDDAQANGVRIVQDGLTQRIMDDYHQSLQVYAHHACPDPEKYQKRHTTLLTKDITEAEIFKTKTDTFAVLDGYAYRQTKKTNLDPGDEQEYIMRSMEYLKENQNGGTSRCFEPCGIKHPIQAWIQQGNPNKGLYAGADITKNGGTLVGFMSFIQNTRQVSAIIASYFEVLYPQEYAVLKPIFDAGKWVQEDKSGFLGRAFVYKLQVSLHNDGKDFPITVTFPSGSYEGGHYLFPQLEVILRYAPGDICFSIAASLYHKLTKWTPPMMKLGDPTTPGRCSSILFCPQETVRQLQDQAPGWGIREHFGRNGNSGERKLIPMKRVGVNDEGEPVYEKAAGRKRHRKRQVQAINTVIR